MDKLLFILLQGPPDPGEWGDPDVLPINDYVHLLAFAGLLLGVFTIGRVFSKLRKKNEA